MATVLPLVWLASEKHFQIMPSNLVFDRVPVKGECVSLGNDTEGHGADYRVMFVQHAPLKPNGIDAEIYLARVYLPTELIQAGEECKSLPPQADAQPDLTSGPGVNPRRTGLPAPVRG